MELKIVSLPTHFALFLQRVTSISWRLCSAPAECSVEKDLCGEQRPICGVR